MLERQAAQADDLTLEEWLLRLESEPDRPLAGTELAALRGTLRIAIVRDRERGDAAEAMQYLAEAGELLNASLELKPTIQNMLRLALPRFGDWATVDLFDDRGFLRTYAVQHADSALQRFAAAMENRPHFDPNASHGIPKVARTGEYELLPSIPDSVLEEIVPDPQDRVMYRAWGVHSALVVPMRSRGRIIGTLCFVSGNPARRYTAHDVPPVAEFANRAALSIDNARMYERERKVADTLQAAILPEHLPRVPGLIFDKAYFPGALEAEVGGDWYDAFMLPDGRLAISMGDVGGKGLPAAVTMSEMRHSMRANALDERCTPADVLERADKLLALNGVTLIVTAFFGFIDPVDLTLTYASAGHPGPVLADANGSGRVLPTEGVPLGVDYADPPRVFTEQLHVGALLMLYTDGLLEFDRDIIGAERRIVDAAIELRVKRPRDIAAALQRLVLRDALRKDDIAILSVYFDDRPVERVDITLPAVGPSAALVRRSVERFAQSIGLDDTTLFALQLSVGEAVINAIEHAYAARGGELRIVLERLADAVSATISDRGAWQPLRRSDEPQSAQERGRGLLLIEGFAEDVRINRASFGTTVRFVVPFRVPALAALSVAPYTQA